MREKRRILLLLEQYMIHGAITRKPRGNEGMTDADVALLTRYSQQFLGHDYSVVTTDGFLYHARQFVRWLNNNQRPIAGITEADIIGFLGSRAGQSNETIATLIGALKHFLPFLYRTGLTDADMSLYLPKTRTTKLARIPSVWAHGEVEKLLAAVDRGSPVGKRDYAILLTVAKMGLRTGDVFSLKKQDINWMECRIDLAQSKTKQPVSLPLQDDVGWAIIDYLKNARPACDSPCVFVSHSNSSFGQPLKPVHGCVLMEKYIRQAGIRMTKQQRHGLHSLRHTLATRLLEAKTPLSVIAEILGQVSPDAIEKYLKVDIESLRRCALDPEEVFARVNG
jgi:site-specific recombinase XerD